MIKCGKSVKFLESLIENFDCFRYMEIIETFKPDLFHTLCDGDTNELSGNKRIFNAVNRTESFFRSCAQLYQTTSSLADSMLIGK